MPMYWRVLLGTLTLALGLIALATLLALETRERQIGRVHQDEQRLVKSLAAEHGLLVGDIEGTLRLLAVLPEVRRGQDCQELLRTALRTHRGAPRIARLDASGAVLCAWPEASPFPGLPAEWLRQPTRTGLHTGIVREPERRERMMVFAMPVNSGGFVATALDAQWLGARFSDLKLPERTSLTLVDADGIIFARHPDGERFVGSRAPQMEGLPDGLRSEMRGGFEASGPDGRARLFSVATFGWPGSRLALMLGTEKDAVLREVDADFRRDLIVIVAFAALFGTLAWLFLRAWVLAPIKLLRRAAEQVTEGKPLEPVGGRRAPSEIAEAIGAYDRMVLRLGEREAQLRESEALFRTLADVASIGIFRADTDGLLTFRNRFLERFAVAGVPWTAMLHAGDAERTRGRWQREVASAGVFRGDFRLKPAAGSELWVHCEIVADPASGARAYIGVMTDLTELRESEARLRQVEKLDALGELTGGVAHDFNNLLMVLLGALERVELEAERPGGPRPEKIREIAGSAHRAGLRGRELTRRLLAFARGHDGEVETIDVAAALEGVRTLVQRSVEGEVRIDVSVEPQAGHIRVDRADFEAALVNLILNARDARPADRRVAIAARRVDAAAATPLRPLTPGSYVEIAVHDRGIGIPAELLDRVLEPFFTTKPPGRGTGLGLSIVYGFVRRAGGDLRIRSEAGLGTRVYLWLPAADAPPAQPAKRSSESGSETARRLGTVLLVEDEPEVRAVAAEFLATGGYRVVEARSAEEALLLLSADRTIDAVLSDVLLGSGMDGRALAAAIRREHAGLPILLMSARRDLAPLPADDLPFLAKPFTRDELLQFLRSVGERARADRESP
jgi:PAS domain S-box-containing protein